MITLADIEQATFEYVAHYNVGFVEDPDPKIDRHIAVRSIEEAVETFREFLLQRPELVEEARRELRGKNLACWCAHNQPCHADVLLELANSPETG